MLYEPSDSGAPFKMIFTRATSGVNATTLWAATSLDGVNWSSVGQVLSISSGWESTYLETSGKGRLDLPSVLQRLEHFPTGMNRLGFPKRRESDSSWMLAREVSMHDQGAFR